MQANAWINSTTSGGKPGWNLRISKCSGGMAPAALTPPPFGTLGKLEGAGLSLHRCWHSHINKDLILIQDGQDVVIRAHLHITSTLWLGTAVPNQPVGEMHKPCASMPRKL